MQVACIMATWHCGVVVKLLALAACFVNLKVGGSNPLLGYTSSTDVFSLHPAVAWYFATLLLPRDGSYLSAKRSKFLERTLTRRIQATLIFLVKMEDLLRHIFSFQLNNKVIFI